MKDFYLFLVRSFQLQAEKIAAKAINIQFIVNVRIIQSNASKLNATALLFFILFFQHDDVCHASAFSFN